MVGFISIISIIALNSSDWNLPDKTEIPRLDKIERPDYTPYTVNTFKYKYLARLKVKVDIKDVSCKD